MDSLNDILSRKDLDEPGEITAIKSYVERKYDSRVGVSVNASSIIVTANSAALANTLRLQIADLKRIANTNKKIVFRINS